MVATGIAEYGSDSDPRVSPSKLNLHEFVIEQLLVFGLVAMADNHFIDIGLRELLGFETRL
jgi:hypothetical protein